MNTPKKNRRTALRAAAALTAAAITGLALMAAALAGPLDQPKASGLVGEGLNGYASVVNPAAPDAVKQLVADINAQRRNHYQSIAKKNSTSLQAVEAVFGQRLTASAAAGTFVQGPSGNWVRR